MKPEDRITRLEAQHTAAFSMLRRLMSLELSHRALMLALLDQPGLNFQRLEEDYEAYLLRNQEQVPPDQRDDSALDLFSVEIRDRMSRRAR